MSMTLTTGQRLENADREVEEVKQAFVDALSELKGVPEVDQSFDERWSFLAERLRTLRSDLRAQDYDKEQLAELYGTFFEIRDLMDEARAQEETSHDTLDRLLILIERIRHVVRDALDEHVNGIDGDAGILVRELSSWLSDVPNDRIAELLGVDRRTLSRWAGRADAPAHRLQLVARLVAILRHNWTQDGVVAWFHRPRRDLGNRTPLSVLNDRNYDPEALIMAARAGRSQYAS